MANSVHAQDRWYPTSKSSITSIDAANALKSWWNDSFDFQKSKKGSEKLIEASALNLMAARGEEGFTEDEVLILHRKIQEMRVSCEIGALISRGDICVSLVEKDSEQQHYEIAFQATE
jgi:hypothetical protein